MIQTDPLRMNDICFKQFSALIHQMMGITIGADRKEMLSGRLRSRMRELDLDTYESYFEYLTTNKSCLLYTSPSPRDLSTSRMPSSA